MPEDEETPYRARGGAGGSDGRGSELGRPESKRRPRRHVRLRQRARPRSASRGAPELSGLAGVCCRLGSCGAGLLQQPHTIWSSNILHSTHTPQRQNSPVNAVQTSSARRESARLELRTQVAHARSRRTPPRPPAALRPRAARKPLRSKRLLRAAGGAEAALLGKHALKPIVGRAIRRALHGGSKRCCACACSDRWAEGHRLESAGSRAGGVWVCRLSQPD